MKRLGQLPAGWRPLGVPLDWTSPILMVALAIGFHILMTKFQWGRAVFALGGNPVAALYSGVRVELVQASVYVIAALLAALSGVALVIVQGQGKADLAMGYELDVIASAVVGVASLAGGRGSVIGASQGPDLGVLHARREFRRNVPKSPHRRTVVIVIVVMDQVLQKRKVAREKQ